MLPTVKILEGDALEVLRSMADGSVHMCITSPPYWGLRDYGTAAWEGGNGECDHGTSRMKERPELVGCYSWSTRDATPTAGACPKCGARRIDSQLGLEATPEAYLESMVAVFREVRRVLRDDGTIWVNMGDGYTGNAGTKRSNDGYGPMQARRHNQSEAPVIQGLSAKNLIGMPWRLAFALQADGWWLRSDIIWAKPNPMPESVTDRPTKSHEHVFLLSKSARYFWDADAVREKAEYGRREYIERTKSVLSGRVSHGSCTVQGGDPESGRNLRDVWTIPTQAFGAAHFATFPERLVEPCIKAGTSEKGCCPECGAGWVRVVEKPKPPVDAFTGTSKPDDGCVNTTLLPGGARVGSGQKLQDWLNRNPPLTTGWRPGCECYDDKAGPYGTYAHLQAIPCTILDPFVGSGTTALVAAKLGRSCIGIELNPDYAKMARKRVQAACGLLATVL